MRLLPLFLPFLLSSCVVLSVPVDETLNVVVSGATELFTYTGEASPCELRAKYRLICIEYNPLVAMPDLVPGMQLRLKQLGINSALYSPGTMPASCDATLRYTAVKGWAKHFSAEQAEPYMNQAELTLFRGGQLLAVAQHQTGRMGFDKWSSTASKLGPVVDKLVCKSTNWFAKD